MREEQCANCGANLTNENIRRAVQKAEIPQEELVFCCPSYRIHSEDWESFEACLGYHSQDYDLPAYWRVG